DRSTYLHALIKVKHVAIVHADAAEGNKAANRVRPVGAMDGVLIDAQRHGRGTHRILRAAARNDVGQARLFAPDIVGRRPRRPEKFSVDIADAAPRPAGLADAHGVADGLA